MDIFQANFQNKVKARMLLIVIALCMVNFLTMKFFWYDIMWWFDMPMHFFGGVFVGLLTFYIYIRKISKSNEKYSEKRMMSFILLFTILISFGWEVFEYFVAAVTHGSQIHMLDSLSDIFFDMAGMCTALIYIFTHTVHPSARTSQLPLAGEPNTLPNRS